MTVPSSSIRNRDVVVPSLGAVGSVLIHGTPYAAHQKVRMRGRILRSRRKGKVAPRPVSNAARNAVGRSSVRPAGCDKSAQLFSWASRSPRLRRDQAATGSPWRSRTDFFSCDRFGPDQMTHPRPISQVLGHPIGTQPQYLFLQQLMCKVGAVSSAGVPSTTTSARTSIFLL